MKLVEVVRCVTTSEEAFDDGAGVRALGGQARDPHQGQGRLHRQPPARAVHARRDPRLRRGRRLGGRDRRGDEGRRGAPDGAADARRLRRPGHARLDLRRAVRRVPRAALRAPADAAQDAQRGLVRAQVGDGLLRLLGRDPPASSRTPAAVVERPTRSCVCSAGLARLHSTDERSSSLRVADADREQLVEELREHALAGRLTSEELEERIGGAYSATTRARPRRAARRPADQLDVGHARAAQAQGPAAPPPACRRRAARSASRRCASACGCSPAGTTRQLLAGLGDRASRCCPWSATRGACSGRRRTSTSVEARLQARHERRPRARGGRAVARRATGIEGCARGRERLERRHRARARGRPRAPPREGARAGQAAGARARRAAARRRLLRRGGAARELAGGRPRRRRRRHRGGRDRRARGRADGQRPDRQGRLVGAEDGREDPAHPGTRAVACRSRWSTSSTRPARASPSRCRCSRAAAAPGASSTTR